MKFKEITIKNFRNFKNTKVSLENKNIFFGMNDIGKTNFLHALRLIFDNNIRKNELLESDYYKFDINTDIEIKIAIDISDFEDDDTKNIISKSKGTIQSDENLFFIQLIGEYVVKDQKGIVKMYWGGDENELSEIKANGYSFEIDKLFEVVFIDSYLDLKSLFKKNVGNILEEKNQDDDDIVDKINNLIANINEEIASLSNITKLQNDLTEKYKELSREQLEIIVRSDVGLNGLYSDLVPFMKSSNSESLYPTAGDGRKKLLAYSLMELINSNTKRTRIPIYLIEEPENHLHKSLQISLSKMFFEELGYKYLFVTTHSPYLLYEMNNVNLVRVFKKDELIDTCSEVYIVGDEYKSNKKIINKNLAEALFATRVLLVEGPSEEILFEKILSVVSEDYYLQGKYILAVNGVAFTHYYNILKDLNIDVLVKTDNDLQKYPKHSNYSPSGFMRCNKLIEDELLSTDDIIDGEDDSETRVKIFEKSYDLILKLGEEHSVYLSKVALEYDLNETFAYELEKDHFAHSMFDEQKCRRLEEILNLKKDHDPVSYLENKKWERMFKVVNNLNNHECYKLFYSDNFKCLERFCM